MVRDGPDIVLLVRVDQTLYYWPGWTGQCTDGPDGLPSGMMARLDWTVYILMVRGTGQCMYWWSEGLGSVLVVRGTGQCTGGPGGLGSVLVVRVDGTVY